MLGYDRPENGDRLSRISASERHFVRCALNRHERTFTPKHLLPLVLKIPNDERNFIMTAMFRVTIILTCLLLVSAGAKAKEPSCIELSRFPTISNSPYVTKPPMKAEIMLLTGQHSI